MLGGILVAIITAVLLPFLFLVGGLVICTIMGWSLWKNGEATHEASELVDLNT
ncbi:MAG: hypothetical protein QOJ09_3154 [Actinomycetota bacterium]|nr:hypothetical protein [Actinomycetota bacterium]